MHSEDQELNINITYGSACNMKCKYCLQDSSNVVHKGDIHKLILGIKNYLTKHNRTIRNISHWGGETLLYLPKIKEVIAAFPDAYNNHIATNGLLVDEKYVAYANSVSTIHTNFSIHEEKVSDLNYRCIAKLNRVSMSGVFFKGVKSAEYYRPVWEHIYNLTGRPLPIGIIFEKAAGDCPKECYVTKEDIESFFVDFLENIYPKACAGDEFCRRVICSFLYDCRARANSPIVGRCYSDRVLSIDPIGNILGCHHRGAKDNIMGNLYKKVIPINPPHTDKYFASEKCQKCEALSMCKGGCFNTNNHEAECFGELWKWHIYTVLETKNRKYGLRDCLH